MTTIINCTPHEIVLFRGEEIAARYPSSGIQVRLVEEDHPMEPIDGFPAVLRTYSDVVGLPEPKKGTYYIVSIVVLKAVTEMGRTDCISPDTGKGAVRKDGVILGTRNWVV